LLVEGDHRRPRTLALFPPDLRYGTGVVGIVDVPLRSPELIHRGDLIAKRQNGRLAGLLHKVSLRYSR
jgi:hypothetical protein